MIKRFKVLVLVLIVTSIVSGYSALLLFTSSPYLSSTDTAIRMQTIQLNVSLVLNHAAKNLQDLTSGNITIEEFESRILVLKSTLTDLGNELTALQKIADRSYLQSIELLNEGIHSFVEALVYASDLNLEKTIEYLAQGTEYVNQSKNAMP